MAQKRVEIRDAVLFVVTSIAGPTVGYATTSPPDLIWGCVQFGEGNFTMSMPDAPVYVPDRNRLDDVRPAPEAPIDISFDGKFVGLRLPPHPTSVGNTYSIEELVTGISMDNADYMTRLGGLPEPWLISESVGGDLTACIPYCTWLELHINPMLSCPNVTIEGEAQLFRFFRRTNVQVDISASQASISGNAHILAPVVQRLAFAYTDIANAAPLAANTWAQDPREA